MLGGIHWEIVTIGLLVFSAEIGLIVAMRAATKEIKGFRGDLPKMLGTFGGLSLLMEAVRTYQAQVKNATERRSKSRGSTEG